MRIAFIDHHLDNWHANVFLKLLRADGKHELIAAWESHPPADGDWCVANGVTRGAYAEEACELADGIMVLAPDNAEDHLALALHALGTGKPVFVDKYLSPSLDDANAMVRCAGQHGTPLMSCSALRFADEVEALAGRIAGPVGAVFCRGNGPWRGYACHAISPALRFFGHGIARLVDTGTPGVHNVTLDDGRRRATIEVRDATNRDEAIPWSLGVLTNGRYEVTPIAMQESFYRNTLEQVLGFFATGQSPVPVSEQIACTAIEDLAAQSLAQGGEWISCDS